MTARHLTIASLVLVTIVGVTIAGESQQREPSSSMRTLDMPAIGVPRQEMPAQEDPCVPTRPGIIEVEIWLGQEPLRGATVVAAPMNRVNLSGEYAEEVHVDVLRGVTDENGLACLSPLPSDGTYCIRVRSGELDAHQITSPIDREVPDRRYVFRFGLGGIEGRVFHDDGSPWVDRLVRLDSRDHEHGSFFSLSTRTSIDGSYRLRGLSSCFAIVMLPSTHDDAFSVGDDRSACVHLEESEWKRVDFGSDGPKTRWSGQLIATSRESLEVVVPIGLEDLDRGNLEMLETRSDGSFSIELVPGRYRAECFVVRGDCVLGEFEIRGPAVESDITIPGAWIGGRVQYVGTWPDKSLPARTAQLLLWNRDDEHLRGHASRGDDHYWFLGVDPGEYWISAHPQTIVGADAEGRIPVVVTADRPLVQLDLTIQDP